MIKKIRCVTIVIAITKRANFSICLAVILSFSSKWVGASSISKFFPAMILNKRVFYPTAQITALPWPVMILLLVSKNESGFS